MSSDKKRGLYEKYIVQRTDESKKHASCEYFVLDLMHDKFAFAALMAYASACEKDYPFLASDIWRKLDKLDKWQDLP